MWCYCWYSFHALYIGMPINLIMPIMVVIWVPLHFWALRTVSPQAGYKHTFFFCLSRANSVLRLFFPWSTPLLRKKGFLFVICMCFYVLLVLFSNLIKSLTNCIKGNKKKYSKKTGFNKSRWRNRANVRLVWRPWLTENRRSCLFSHAVVCQWEPGEINRIEDSRAV